MGNVKNQMPIVIPTIIMEIVSVVKMDSSLIHNLENALRILLTAMATQTNLPANPVNQVLLFLTMHAWLIFLTAKPNHHPHIYASNVTMDTTLSKEIVS